MKIRHLFYTIVFAGLVAGCATPVYVEQDNSIALDNYKTYMWVDTRASESDSTQRATGYADISVHNAVNDRLRAMGWTEANENPDALVSYDLLVERTTSQQSDAVYSQPFSRSYYNRFTRRWSTIYYPSQFLGYESYQVAAKEGTVTISLMDAKTDKVIWQGWTTERLNYNRITSDEISRSVKNIFRKFGR